MFDAVLVYLKYYNGDNKTLRTLHHLLEVGMPFEHMLRQPILDAIHPRGHGLAAANDLHLEAHDPMSDDFDSGTPPTKDYIQEHAAAILQALGQVHDLAPDSSVQVAIKEFEEGLRKTLLNPDFIRYALLRPKYDGKGLRRVIKTKLRTNPRLQETLTNVVVPTFDVHRNQPIIFSTSQVRMCMRVYIIHSHV